MAPRKDSPPLVVHAAIVFASLLLSASVMTIVCKVSSIQLVRDGVEKSYQIGPIFSGDAQDDVSIDTYPMSRAQMMGELVLSSAALCLIVAIGLLFGICKIRRQGRPITLLTWQRLVLAVSLTTATGLSLASLTVTTVQVARSKRLTQSDVRHLVDNWGTVANGTYEVGVWACDMCQQLSRLPNAVSQTVLVRQCNFSRALHVGLALQFITSLCLSVVMWRDAWPVTGRGHLFMRARYVEDGYGGLMKE